MLSPRPPCSRTSWLQACDLAVHLPLERELCPFDLAPVTSTTIQMLFGDTVAIALMQVGSGCPAAWRSRCTVARMRPHCCAHHLFTILIQPLVPSSAC